MIARITITAIIIAKTTLNEIPFVFSTKSFLPPISFLYNNFNNNFILFLVFQTKNHLNYYFLLVLLLLNLHHHQ